MATAKKCGETYPRVRQLREKLVEELHEFMEVEAIADSATISSWRGNLAVDREKLRVGLIVVGE